MATEGNLVSLARRGGDVPGEHQYNFVNNTRDREEKNKDMGDKRENAEEEEARGSAAGYLLERMFRWWHGLLRQLWRRRHVALVRTAAGDAAKAESYRHGRNVEGPTRVQSDRRPVHATSVAVAPRGGCAPEKMQVRSEQRRSVSYPSPPHVITQRSPPARSSAHNSLPKSLLPHHHQLEPVHRDTPSVHNRPISCSQASSGAQKHQRTCRLPCKSARTALGGDARSASPRHGRPAPALRPRPPPFESETPPGCGRHRPTTPPDQSASPATSAATPGIAASRGQRAVGQPPKRRHGRQAWRQQHP